MRRGFSLLELAMVVAVSGLMLGYMLQAGTISNNKECYVSTKVQLQAIRNAIDIFARKNDRLPMPAARNVGIESTTYGREASGADIDTVGTASWGALPFQTLGMPSTFAGDCWGNKFTYVVTTALTTDNTSGGFKDSTVIGTLTQKTTTTVNFSTTTAYAVISHGEDGLGAVKLNYSAANPSHGWCAGVDLKHLNCLATSADVGAGVFNNGKDAGTAYFDDLIAASGKPQIIEEASGSNIYCWGDSTYGQIGDSTNDDRAAPVPITLPTGVDYFVSLSVGAYHNCAMGNDGNAYCWGAGNDGRLGTGNTTSQNKPTLVTGGHSFKSIKAGGGETFGITTAGANYAWGYNDPGQLATGNITSYSVPTSLHASSPVFTRFYLSGNTNCGLTADNTPYCWGNDYHYTLGDDAIRQSYSLPQLVAGGHKFIKMAIGVVACGLKANGEAWCWGNGGSGTVGDGMSAVTYTPVQVSTAERFVDITAGEDHICALKADGKEYCWGFGGYGQNGWAHNWSAGVPVAVEMTGLTFNSISAANHHSCATATDGKAYCWGLNRAGAYQLGNGTTSDTNVPSQVTGSGTGDLMFNKIGSGIDHVCAMVNKTPPAAWGWNGYGQVGDGTTTTRTNPPVYMTLPTGVKYFKKVTGFWSNKCGIGSDDKVYCTGKNDKLVLGNASAPSQAETFYPVTMPAASPTAKDIALTDQGACMIGGDDKLYCWGHGCVGLGDGGIDTVTPTLVSVPSTTVTKLNLYSYGGTVIGTDGKIYTWGCSAPNNTPYEFPLPAGRTAAKMAQRGHNPTITICMIGDDDLVYCTGSSDGETAIGDGSTSGSTSTFVAVPLPGGVTATKVSTGDNGGGWAFSCALGSDKQIYCWGRSDKGMTTNLTHQYTPLPVALPTGVTGWNDVDVGTQLVIGVGDNGVTYFWGSLWTTDNWAPGYIGTWTPTPLYLPVGADNWKQGSVSAMGMVGLVE